MKKILVTGSAGVIGSNSVLRLLKEGFKCENVSIVGVDNLNDYYDPRVKEYLFPEITKVAEGNSYRFVKGNLADKALIE